MHANVAKPFLLSSRLIIYDAVAKVIARSAADDRFDILKHKLFAVYLVKIDHLSRIKSNISGEHLFGTSAVCANDIYIERAARARTSLRDDLPNTRATVEPYASDLARCRIIINSIIYGCKYDSFTEERSYSHSTDVGYLILLLNFRIISKLNVPIYSCRTCHVKSR